MRPYRRNFATLVVALLALLLGSVYPNAAALGQASPPASDQPAAPALSPAAPDATPAGSIFTYQGNLKKAGQPVNTTCNLQFSLWDALAAGAQVGTTQSVNNVAVQAGSFTVQLDFGNQFTGDGRWLATAGQCTGDPGFTTLSPRQPLNAVPYALGLRPGATVNTTTQNQAALLVGAPAGNANALVATGNGNGFAVIYGEDQSPTGGSAVYGKSAHGVGLHGVGANHEGVVAESTGASGVWASSANWYGVDGVSQSDSYGGVRGTNLGPTGAGPGVVGNSTLGAGVSGPGLQGTSQSGYGVQGASTTGVGVSGTSRDIIGVWGVSTNGNGVEGWASKDFSIGVVGRNTSANGIGVKGLASGTGSVGVWGEERQ